MPKSVKIIALDLDGTLLNSEKELTNVNLKALERAAAAGIEIVPTTGRFYGGMPESIRNLPFVRYVITINGAEVCDLSTGEIIHKAQMPWQQTVAMMEFLDNYPVIYDCYQTNDAFMTAEFKEHINDHIESVHYRKMVRELRKGVPELKAFLTDRKLGVQKAQFFTRDNELRFRLMAEMPKIFENIYVSSSLPDNAEINHVRANKGEALLALADHLGVKRKETLAFGDGLNDLTMIKEAGIGAAMANSCAEILELADVTVPSCDENGVAYGINKFCFGEA